MAHALISVVIQQLGSYAQEQVKLAICAPQEVDMLIKNLKLLHAVLPDADEKQVEDEAVRLWLDDLKQVVYDADDVLDEWNTRDAISQPQSDVDADVAAGNLKKVFSCLLSLCLLFKHAILRHDIGRQIKDINKRLDGIINQITIFSLNQKHDEPRQMTMTSSVVDVSKIHGRDQAKENILSRLLGECSSHGEVLRVFCIVGIGGLGKTTLAKIIFHERRVVETFKTKMWVCVSEPFNLVKVAKAIIKEAGGRVPNSSVWQEVHESLCESVKGKQFLLVLDDVWTEDPSHWDDLKLAFDGGAPGSRIIVTTRNQTVAIKMGCTNRNIHDLEILSKDDSWSMIKDVALVEKKEEELEGFEEVGRKIATKCKGIPLAIRTVASLLCVKQTKEEWANVLSSDLWEMREIKNFFLPSLFLSYCSLDPISKQCFQYSAIFPKDFQIEKDQLIKLWMAQGFFEFGERRDLESIGEEQFSFLAMRSFFQDFKKDSDGNITSCKMHDLVHDFAMYVSQNEYSHLQAGGTISDSDKTRHLYANDLEIPSILKARKLRTLVLYLETAVPVDLFNTLACLRTLVLRGSKMEVLPNEVEKCVHLRYLDLSGSYEMLKLPETICNLYNLQVLALNRCKRLHKLPEKIEKLSNLRHLEIEGTDDLSYFPKSFAKLSSLRTLSKFIVSDRDRGCNIGDLELLNNLQGALKLEGLGRVTDGTEADRAKLNEKKKLRKLTLDFGRGIRMKNILEKLKPHEDMKVIQISNYTDTEFPGWFQSCSLLPHIVKMSLYGCNGCKELPAFGKLPLLKTLEMEGMSSVTRIGSEFYGEMTAFPKLESFVIKDMEKLEEWEVPISKDRKIMSLLVEMRLYGCLMLRALPCLGSLESLKSLRMVKLPTVSRIGEEFYGFGADSSLDPTEMISFPKLKTFEIKGFDGLEEWDIPISRNRKIMPLLTELELRNFPKLRALPRVWRMESLEELRLVKLPSLQTVGGEFGNEGSSQQDGVTFPKLKTLVIQSMDGIEEWSVPLIAPCLQKLRLEFCLKLKTLPTFEGCVKTLEFLQISYMRSWEGQEKLVIISDKEASSSSSNQGGGGVGSCSLRSLAIEDCPKLRVVPKDYMFSPSLQELELYSDVGDLYNSFPTDDTLLCSITQVWLNMQPHSSLPNGFHQLKSLQSLKLYNCLTLDFDLKEGLGHFTELQHLEIQSCPHLEEHFEGDDWRTILAHVPKITINGREITKK